VDVVERDVVVETLRGLVAKMAKTVPKGTLVWAMDGGVSVGSDTIGMSSGC